MRLTCLCAPLMAAVTLSAATAAAQPAYTVVVFPALCGTASAPSCSVQEQPIRDLWLDRTDLIDGGTYDAFDYPDAEFLPGRVYLVSTEYIPNHGNTRAPPYTPARSFEIHAHWQAVRAWVEKAAESADHLVLAAHSFSGPGLVWAMSTSSDPRVHNKVNTVMTVTSPMAGHPLAVWPACTAYSPAFCSLFEPGRQMQELRTVTEAAILNPNIDLSRKLIAVSAETTNTTFWGPTGPTGSDGLIDVSSQIFLAPNWPIYRNQRPSTADPSYQAIFHETVNCNGAPCNQHVYANDGIAAQAAVRWINRRQPGGADYCTLMSCGEGQGDCEPNANQCAGGLRCVSDVGADYGFANWVDVCEAPGTREFCDGAACAPGQGDCDSHAQCSGANGRCMSNIGPAYGWSAGTDVCLTRSNGAGDYCSREFRCGYGEGHCSSTAECAAGLTCTQNAGWSHGLPYFVDVCQ